MENITKNDCLKDNLTSKRTKKTPEQHVCEKGNEHKIIRAETPVKMIDNWLIAESKYRGFYL